LDAHSSGIRVQSNVDFQLAYGVVTWEHNPLDNHEILQVISIEANIHRSWSKSNFSSNNPGLFHLCSVNSNMTIRGSPLGHMQNLLGCAVCIEEDGFAASITIDLVSSHDVSILCIFVFVSSAQFLLSIFSLPYEV
jgi:hypothetical protein